jgi:hypothetical protein
MLRSRRKRARARLSIPHIFGCRSAAFLQKLLWRSSVSPNGTPRAASILIARGRALRDFSQEDQKDRRLDGSPRHSARNAAAGRRRQREPPTLAFCPSDLPVKISIARGVPKPPRKLLRFRLRFGSQKMCGIDRRARARLRARASDPNLGTRPRWLVSNSGAGGTGFSADSWSRKISNRCE